MWIWRLLGKVDFSNLYINLSATPYPSLAKAKEAGAATINYGVFLNETINFLIVSFAIFMLIKQINHLKKHEEQVPSSPTAKECPYCLLGVPLKATRCAHCTSELKPAAR